MSTEIEQINQFKAFCKKEERELTDEEYKTAARLDWKLTCPDCYGCIYRFDRPKLRPRN